MSNVQFLNASFISRKFVGKIQTVQSVRVSVKQDIAEALSLGVDACVNSYEATAGEVSFYGKTNIRLLYSDGINLCSSVYNADFTASIQSDLIEPDTKLTFDVVMVDSKIDTNANTATLTVLLEVSAYAYISCQTPYLEGGEDVFVDSRSVEVLSKVSVLNLPFVLDEELTASRNISSVLLAECSLCAGNYVVRDGILDVSGSGAVRLTYLSDGDVVTDVLPFDFERELEATENMANAQLRIRLLPKTTKVRLDITEGDVNTTFTVEVGVSAQVEVAEIGMLDVIADAYGSDCDFDFVRKAVTTTLPCGSAVCSKHVTVSVPTDENKTPVTAVNVGAVVTNAQSRERSALVEGVVYATLLYKGEQGYFSEQLELPFSQSIDVDYLMPECRTTSRVSVMNFTLDSEAHMDLCITVDSERETTYSVIVDAEQRPFDKSSLPAIEVCLARKGETLWNLAKGLHMSVDDVLATNPQVSNPLEQDARIVIFNKI